MDSENRQPLLRNSASSAAKKNELRNAQKSAEFLFKDESYAIRGAIFEVYKEMGSGYLEAVYQECLRKEFTRQGVPYREQVRLQLSYKGATLKQTYAPDFVCHGKIIVEIKGVRAIAPEHRAQLINYLKATELELGFLVNFGAYPKVEMERMVRSK